MSGIKASPAQKSERNRFKEAMNCANSVLKDPAVKAAYQSKAKNMQVREEMSFLFILPDEHLKTEFCFHMK
jgi:hypothetical protein